MSKFRILYIYMSFSQYLATYQKQHLNLKKMAKFAKKDETIFAEPMLDGRIDFVVDIISESSDAVAVVASVLASLCMIYCVWSFVKIRTLTAIITLTYIPNPFKAFSTQHPDLSLMYTTPLNNNQVTVLQHIYTSFTTPWPYATLSVFTTSRISTHISLWKFKRSHKTTIHHKLTTGTDSMLLPIASHPICPDNWHIQPLEYIDNFKLMHQISQFKRNTQTNQSTFHHNFTSHIKAYKFRSLLQQPYTAYVLLSN